MGWVGGKPPRTAGGMGVPVCLTRVAALCQGVVGCAQRLQVHAQAEGRREGEGRGEEGQEPVVEDGDRELGIHQGSKRQHADDERQQACTDT